MSLVFYDTETSGTETFFDQILQFAAVLTDEDLQEVDRFEVRCRLLPHVVPAPGAMSVTGVKVSQLTDTACPSHYEMVHAISAKLQSWTPALFLGWNSIRFDEDLIRQALYKTLHNPYPRRLHRTRKGRLVDPKLIAHVCSEPVMRTELLRDFHGQLLLQASFHVNHCQFLQFGLRLRRQLLLFKSNVRTLRVAL